jgi:hypothetical protein
VRALIDAGADVNKATVDRKTPLSKSMTPAFNIARGNHATIFQPIRDAGAM